MGVSPPRRQSLAAQMFLSTAGRQFALVTLTFFMAARIAHRIRVTCQQEAQRFLSTARRLAGLVMRLTAAELQRREAPMC
jgi:hypothetical protein